MKTATFLQSLFYYSAPFQVFKNSYLFFGKEQYMCWGSQQFKQTYTCTYLPTGEGDCLVTIDGIVKSCTVVEFASGKGHA